MSRIKAFFNLGESAKGALQPIRAVFSKETYAGGVGLAGRVNDAITWPFRKSVSLGLRGAQGLGLLLAAPVGLVGGAYAIKTIADGVDKQGKPRDMITPANDTALQTQALINANPLSPQAAMMVNQQLAAMQQASNTVAANDIEPQGRVAEAPAMQMGGNA